MNIHSLQALEAIAESATIANVRACVMSGQQNRPMIGGVYDMLTGAYLLTQDDEFLSPTVFNDAISTMAYPPDLKDLYSRLDVYNIPYVNALIPNDSTYYDALQEENRTDNNRSTVYSGKALFSALLPSDLYYQKGSLIIRNGILIKGSITSDHIGATGGSLIQILWRNYGKQTVTQFLTDLPFIIDSYLANRGFTVGLADCLIDREKASKIVQESFSKGQTAVSALMSVNDLEPLERERRERQIIGILNTVGSVGQKLNKEVLRQDNSLRVMLESGAKGSTSNLAQITGVVGQQFVKGQRIAKTLTDNQRCLPYFPVDDMDIRSQGFCVNSFYQGLDPAEYFFHQSGTRIGLIDTAINTSESGASQRRMIKALEDIIIATDGSVRHLNGRIFSFEYGGDGLDPSQIILVQSTLHFIDLETEIDRLNFEFEQTLNQ